MKPGSNKAFLTCEHGWQLHGDITNVSGPAAGNTVFRCPKCTNVISLTEKCAVDQADLQKKSLQIQEGHTRNGMFANMIAAAALIVAVLVLIFGDAIVSSSNKSLDPVDDPALVDLQIQNP